MISIKNKTTHHLLDYEKVQATFSWGNVARDLDGFPNGKGLNLTHESVDRHAQTRLKNTVALRFIRKDNRSQEFTYIDLQKQTSKFANVLQKLKIQKGERVFSFAGRIPELYSTVLGTLKYTAVFCPLFSVFGPEPMYQRLCKGDAAVLVTTTLLFEKKIKQILEKLPSLRYIILTDATEHVSEKTEIASNVETKMNIMAFARKEMGPALLSKKLNLWKIFPKPEAEKFYADY